MYVAFEGIDTAGKSTQIKRLRDRFDDVLITREPGGTDLGRKIRALLLEEGGAHARAEALLFLADRAEHIEKVIRPNLHRTILSDRSFVSGIAYAHVHEGIAVDTLIAFNRFATGNLFPDTVVLLELDEATLRHRLKQKAPDAIERRGIGYMLKVQSTMKELTDLLAIDTLVVDASLPMERITDTIEEYLKKRMKTNQVTKEERT